MKLTDRIDLTLHIGDAGQIVDEQLSDMLGDQGVWDLITRDEFAFEVTEHIEQTGEMPTKNELAETLIDEITVLLETKGADFTPDNIIDWNTGGTA